jgi:hypothetical protein
VIEFKIYDGSRIMVRPEAIILISEFKEQPNETVISLGGPFIRVMGSYEDVVELVNQAVQGY